MMKNKLFFYSVIPLIAFLLFTDALFANGPDNSVRSRNNISMKIIELLKKSLAKGNKDSAVFIQGINLLDNSKISNDEVTEIDKESINFKTDKYASFYIRLKVSLYNSLLRNEAFEKAIEFANKQIDELDNKPQENFIKLRQILLFKISKSFIHKPTEWSFKYYTKKLNQYLISNDSSDISICYFILHRFYYDRGLNDLCIYSLKKSMAFVKDKTAVISNIEFGFPLFGKDAWININACIGQSLIDNKSYSESIQYSLLALKNCLYYSNTFWDSSNIAYTNLNIGYAKLKLNQTDSVSYFLDLAIKVSKQTHEAYTEAMACQVKGQYYYKINKFDSAEIIIKKCALLMAENNIPHRSPAGTLTPHYYLAMVYKKLKRYKDAEKLILEEIPKIEKLKHYVLMEYKLITELYICMGDYKSSTKYFQLISSVQEQIDADELENRAMSFEMEKKMDEAENTISNLENQKEIATISRNYIIGIACLIFVIAIIIYNRYRLKQKSNAQLAKTLQELKDTQQQLLQSEKLAAFGAVATRVAHEIQNPLNFVNNFSQLSEELVTDIISANNEEEKKESAKLLIDNLQKINHHGKRADKIVKQLFEHTKAGTAHEYFEDEK